jgi:Tol biopolymer transport system component
MTRHVVGFSILLLALVSGACNRDAVTGLPPMAARNGAGPKQLNDAIAFFTRQFSPIDGGLAVMNVDGSGRRPLAGGERGFEPSISPDARRIAFTRSPDGETVSIYVMNVDGTGTTSIVQGLVFPPGAVWSPDGSQIAFRSNHEGQTGPVARISIVNADGTGLRQVSPEPGPNEFAYDESPTWSPTGTQLAFTRNSVLHVINGDGTGMTALPNEDLAINPSWSPDGQRIAYTSLDPAGDIHVRNADGSNLVAVTTMPEFEGWPRWSPDSRQLAFSRTVGEQVNIFTINADGTGEVRLTPDGVSDFMPDWSPCPSASCAPGLRVQVTPATATLGRDETVQATATVRSMSGTVIDHAMVAWSSTDASVVTVTPSGLVTAVGPGTAQIQATFANATGSATVTVTDATVLRNVIVYTTEEFGPSELAVVNPDGSGRRRLTTDGRGYFSPAVSPDGRRIVFAGFGGIFLMNADATGVTHLVGLSQFDQTPAWSPDGRQIAFRSMKDGPFGAYGRIFVINVDGTGLRQLSPENVDPNAYTFDDWPTWSRDGSKVAFSRSGALHVINLDGTGLTTLPSPEGAEAPSFSPDGTRIAYTSFISTRDVFISNADGSNPVRVTSAPEQENNPRWSPDGRQLVFCRVVNGFFQLFTINADGTGESKLSANPNTFECSPSWSPVP